MRNKHSSPNLPTLPLLPAPASAPPDAFAAAQDAIARAAEAASRGQTGKADRESRLAERLERLARSTALHVEASQPEPEPPPEVFILELERRINRYRQEKRQELDELKARDPAAWKAAYDADRASSLAKVDAYWIGDPRLFDEPEGGYPEFTFK